MKRTLLRHKTKKFPKMPDSLETIRDTFLDPEIIQKFGMNYERDCKFYIDTVITDFYAFTIFASKYVIDFIEENIEPKSRNYLMDGTFDHLPKEYDQLLIISIEYMNDVSYCCKYLTFHLSVRNY